MNDQQVCETGEKLAYLRFGNTNNLKNALQAT